MASIVDEPAPGQTYQPYTNEQGVLMVPRTDANGNLIEYVPQDTLKQPGGLPPDQSYPGAEQGPTAGAAPPTEADPAANPATRERIQQWYQQYLGRGASDGEINDWLRDHPDLSGIEEGLKNSAEGKAYAAKGAGGTGGTPAWTYGDDAQAAWMAWPGPGTVANIKTFADAWNKAHPNDLVSLGGSKGEKLTWRGKTYDTVISAGTGGTGKSWQDLSLGGSSGGAAGAGGAGVDDSYLAGYPGAPFDPSAEADLPPGFTYEDFQRPGDFKGVDAAALEADPSYQFRKDQAMGALQASASGKGLTNSGGTLHDLLGLSSQFASQEYGNVWDRKFKEWQDTYNTALTDYVTKRSNAADVYTKQYGRAGDIYGREKDEFDKSVTDYYTNRDSAFDKLYKMSSLGANVTTAG